MRIKDKKVTSRACEASAPEPDGECVSGGTSRTEAVETYGGRRKRRNKCVLVSILEVMYIGSVQNRICVWRWVGDIFLQIFIRVAVSIGQCSKTR